MVTQKCPESRAYANIGKMRSELSRFVGFCVCASVAYGWAHDLVTAHVAPLYFTEYHPKLVESQSPLVMALIWGVLATFWVGAIGGVGIGLANIAGRWPPLEWARLRRAVVKLLVACWLLSMAALAGVYSMSGRIPLNERRATYERDRRLVAVAVAHGVGYTVSAGGALALAAWTLGKRYRSRPR